jgi:hypothetical protein
VLVSLFAFLLAAGAIAAGTGYVRAAHRMRRFRSTPGQVLSRSVVAVSADRREGRWGRGGGYAPAATYAFTVDGVERVGDRISYAERGLKLAVAEREAAMLPDEVTVWFDPDDPAQAYLKRHAPTVGWALIAGGTLLAVGAVGGIAGTA